MPLSQTGATQYHAQLGLPDKGGAIKQLVVCNNWDLEPLDQLNVLALGCYQPSPLNHGMTSGRHCTNSLKKSLIGPVVSDI